MSGDDVYLFEPWLLEALQNASSHPAEEAVCAGHVNTLPWKHAKETRLCVGRIFLAEIQV